jgi:hypothetical protein
MFRIWSSQRFYFALLAAILLAAGIALICTHSRNPSTLVMGPREPVEDSLEDAPDLVQFKEPPDEPEAGRIEIQVGDADESGWVDSGNPESIPLLIRYLKSPEEVVQRAALAEFAGMGAKAKTAVPAILEVLNDADSSIRVDAAAALIHMNSQIKVAVRALLKELKAENAAIRAHAAKVIGELVYPAPDLGTHCWGPDPPPRIARFWLGKSAEHALEEALNDREATVRASAAEALNKLRRLSRVMSLTRR